MYWNAGRLVNVPVWAFHGEKDSTVFVEESKKMVDAVNAKALKNEHTDGKNLRLKQATGKECPNGALFYCVKMLFLSI